MKVVPGALLGTEEEVVPGANAVQDGSEIYAAVAGQASVREKVAAVKQAVMVPTLLKLGDIVVGRIEEIFEPVALINMGLMKDEKTRTRQAAYPGYAVLHASRVKEGYVKNIHDEVKIGDVIRARVEEIKKEDVSLSTNARNLGVIMAFCTECRAVMERKGSAFHCAVCDRNEGRKMAEE